MPEIGDVVDTKTEDTKPPVAGEETGTEGVVEAVVVEEDQKPDEAPKKTKKKVSDGEDEGSAPKLVKPPMDQLHRDFDAFVTTLEIDGHKLKKLPYKCGKIIYGIESKDGKDFRVIALKARKKTKSVAGKSRCIYYFGTNTKVDLKDLPATTISKFGKCSVQSKQPIEFKLDKVSYHELFGQDYEKVITTLKKLAGIAVEHKVIDWEELQAKKAAKAEAKAAKKKKAAKTEAASEDEKPEEEE